MCNQTNLVKILNNLKNTQYNLSKQSMAPNILNHLKMTKTRVGESLLEVTEIEKNHWETKQNNQRKNKKISFQNCSMFVVNNCKYINECVWECIYQALVVQYTMIYNLFFYKNSFIRTKVLVFIKNLRTN